MAHHGHNFTVRWPWLSVRRLLWKDTHCHTWAYWQQSPWFSQRVAMATRSFHVIPSNHTFPCRCWIYFRRNWWLQAYISSLHHIFFNKSPLGTIVDLWPVSQEHVSPTKRYFSIQYSLGTLVDPGALHPVFLKIINHLRLMFTATQLCFDYSNHQACVTSITHWLYAIFGDLWVCTIYNILKLWLQLYTTLSSYQHLFWFVVSTAPLKNMPASWNSHSYIPDAPCMEYLPTFTP